MHNLMVSITVINIHTVIYGKTKSRHGACLLMLTFVSVLKITECSDEKMQLIIQQIDFILYYPREVLNFLQV